jgi:NADPH-dependent ferric siderophore reductase
MGSSKKPRVQHLLQVVRTQQLTPHMVRVVLGGEGFSRIEFKDDTDQYIKLLFADPALELERPYDMDALRETLTRDQMPVTRTYTIRHIDHAAEEIWVDFVTHGAAGLAGPWAESAQPGDLISFFGPGSGYAPRPDAEFHLLAGDESALPAIAAGVESMPADARGLVLLEAASEDERLPIEAPSGVELRWLYRGGDFTVENARLAEEVEALELPDVAAEEIQVFVHGEREQMKRIRRHLVDERGLPRKGMSLSAYWAYGRAEDVFQAEKRTPVGQIDPA